jgi:hypothetical protein
MNAAVRRSEGRAMHGAHALNRSLRKCMRIDRSADSRATTVIVEKVHF